MRFSLGAAAALAGISQAILLPPSVSSSDIKIVDTIPFEVEALADARVLEIDCPGCPVEVTSKGLMNWGNAESILRLNFTVEHNDVDHLMLNGLQIYPVDPSSQSFMIPLTADQLIKAPDNTWAYSSSPKLGYSIAMKHPMSGSAKDRLSIVSIHFEVIEVADKFIHGIPTVDLQLIETPSKKLMLADAKISQAASSVPRPGDIGQECTTLLCKWRAIIAGKVEAMKKGCGKGRGKTHGRPRPFHGIKGGPKKFDHAGPHGAHHGHRRPHHNAFGRFLRSITLHIIVPILIGVVVGVSASLVGMVVGHILIFFWRLVFRRGQRGQYNRVQQEEASADGDDETKSFLANQGPPPHYEDAVAVTEEKVEQK